MRFLQLILLLLTVSLSACKGVDKEDPVVLAEVGGKALTVSMAKAEIPQHVFESDSVSAYVKYRDNWIRRQLILQEADRLNFEQRKHIQQNLERIREDFILQAVQDFVISEFEKELIVSKDEARNYYQQNKDSFILDERYVQYRHMVARSNQDAQNAKRDIMRGIDWETVAKKYSLNPELKIRESQQYWPISVAGGDIPLLNRYLNIIGPSEISPIHKSGNEYHFVQLMHERPKGDHPDLDWLINQIEEWLVLEKRKRAFNTYVKNLYLQGQANNEIKIYNVQTEESIPVDDTVSLNNPTNEE